MGILINNSLSQWLNFKLFGITYLVGKIKFKLFFQVLLAEWEWESLSTTRWLCFFGKLPRWWFICPFVEWSSMPFLKKGAIQATSRHHQAPLHKFHGCTGRTRAGVGNFNVKFDGWNPMLIWRILCLGSYSKINENMGWYCWWFRNPGNSPAEVGRLSPFFKVLYIPGG